MKNALMGLGFGLINLTAGLAAAQADTSILKNGNVWVYERQEENRSAGSLQSGYTGTIRLSIDSLAIAGDTVKFRVTRRDSGQALVFPVGSDPTTITTQSTVYAFRAGAYSPAVPLFATNQTFVATTSPNVEYRGDTLRYKHLTTGGGCLIATVINLERVGLVENSQTSGGCGNTSGVDSYRLLSFNGHAYQRDSVHPVALRAHSARAAARAHGPRLEGFRPRVEYRGEIFDLMGKRSPAQTWAGTSDRAEP